MNNTLKELAYKLDEELGGINIRRDILESLADEMLVVASDLDEAVLPKNRNVSYIYLLELQRQIKIIAELMNYSMKDLNADYEKAHEISTQLFDVTVRGDAEGKCNSYPVEQKEKRSLESKQERIIKQNTETFTKEFGRAPVDYAEVTDWINDLMEEIDEKEQKKPDFSCN